MSMIFLMQNKESFYVSLEEIEKLPNTYPSWRKKMTIQPILQVSPDQIIQSLEDISGIK